MTFVVVIIGGALFGAADQYLGTVHAMNALGWWTVSVSLLSAPWLILPFCAGWTQRRATRAALAGLAITQSALAGYFVMTLSPWEGAHFTLSGSINLVASNRLNVIGGLVTGPAFGWLGSRWRTTRSWWAAMGVVSALSVEPLAVIAVGRGEGRSLAVWTVEVAAGALVGVWFSLQIRRHHAMTRRAVDGSL